MIHIKGLEFSEKRDLLVLPEYALYIMHIFQICISVGIIVIALKYCKRDGSAVLHFFASCLCPPFYLIYKLVGDGCEGLSKTILGIILAVYILMTVFSFLTVSDTNFGNELSELLEKNERERKIEEHNLKVNKYEKRQKEKNEGIIYGTIEE